MIGCVILCYHQDPAPMLEATSIYGDHRVLVIDRSPEVVTDFVNVVRNSDGDGFRAGSMRNIGTSYLQTLYPDIDGIVYFDGDRIPNITPISFGSDDCVLYRGEVDNERKEIDGDITNLCKHPYSPFYSAGFYLSSKALNDLQWQPFDSEFDGYWGWEDSYLGDRIASLGYRIMLSNTLIVSGALVEPEWVRDSNISTDKRFRNWHLRLAKRQHLKGLVTMSEVIDKAKMQVVVIPIEKFNEIVNRLVVLPYKDSAPIIELFNKFASTREIAENVD